MATPVVLFHDRPQLSDEHAIASMMIEALRDSSDVAL